MRAVCLQDEDFRLSDSSLYRVDNIGHDGWIKPRTIELYCYSPLSTKVYMQDQRLVRSESG